MDEQDFMNGNFDMTQQTSPMVEKPKLFQKYSSGKQTPNSTLGSDSAIKAMYCD